MLSVQLVRRVGYDKGEFNIRNRLGTRNDGAVDLVQYTECACWVEPLAVADFGFKDVELLFCQQRDLRWYHDVLIFPGSKQ